jgi:hypothetical protein
MNVVQLHQEPVEVGGWLRLLTAHHTFAFLRPVNRSCAEPLHQSHRQVHRRLRRFLSDWLGYRPTGMPVTLPFPQQSDHPHYGVGGSGGSRFV